MGEQSVFKPEYDYKDVVSVSGAIRQETIHGALNWLKERAQLDIQVEHFFSKGLYARRIHLPAGSVNVSKIHKHPSLSIIATGSVRVASTLGLHTYKAGDVIVAPPGMQRVVCALEDTIWVTVHENANEERDLDALERELIE